MPEFKKLPASRLRPTAFASISLIVAMTLSGCGGGNEGDAVSQTNSGYQVESGQAQKGPLVRGSMVTLNELNATTLTPLGKSYNFEIRDDLGTFKPASTVFSQPLLESTALGYYFDELTGKVSTDIVMLRGLSNLAVDRSVNINLLTDLANARIRALVTRTTAPLTFAAARAQAQREVLDAFFLYNSVDLMPGGTTEPASFGELDLGKNRNADQILAALSAVVTQIGVTGGGISQFINQYEADLGDDGLINNSPQFTPDLTSVLNTAYKSVDFAKLAANLNSFYKTDKYTAASLSQWVDTSGGVDRVINRYKSTAANVPVGTESKSPEYVAGTHDAGQCFSASTGNKLYRNGAVITGTVKSVKGDKFTIGLTGTAANTTVSGFIQRSAPTAGVCPATVPTAALTRLAKHSASATSAVNVTTGTMASAGSANFILKSDGSLWAWGSSQYIGDGTNNSQKTPIKIGTEFSNISTSGNHTIAIKKDGSLWAWGLNDCGQLGDGTYMTRYAPVKIGTGYSAISAGGSFTMAIKSDGSLWAWGSNVYRQLGIYTIESSISSPMKMGTGFISVSAGEGHTVAIKSDRSLWTWGGLAKTAPKQIGADYSSIAAASTHTAAIKTDGSLWTWGGNEVGQLGDGTTIEKSNPTKIGTGYSSVSAKWQTTFAIKSNGTLWAWGYNYYGQLGDGTNTDRHSPIQIGSEYHSISAGNVNALAIKKDGSFLAWGYAPIVNGTVGYIYNPQPIQMP